MLHRLSETVDMSQRTAGGRLGEEMVNSSFGFDSLPVRYEENHLVHTGGWYMEPTLVFVGGVAGGTGVP